MKFGNNFSSEGWELVYVDLSFEGETSVIMEKGGFTLKYTQKAEGMEFSIYDNSKKAYLTPTEIYGHLNEQGQVSCQITEKTDRVLLINPEGLKYLIITFK